MPGVIALLPPPFAGRVESLWDELEARFDIPRGYPGAIPHVTLHIGSHDLDPSAEDIVRRVAAATAPFIMRTAGFGVFAGEVPVLHILVVRSPSLAQLAVTLEHDLAAAGYPATDPYFTPERWIPHITIAHRNLAGASLGPALEWLARRETAWEVPLETISIARETATSAEVLATFTLDG